MRWAASESQSLASLCTMFQGWLATTSTYLSSVYYSLCVFLFFIFSFFRIPLGQLWEGLVCLVWGRYSLLQAYGVGGFWEMTHDLGRRGTVALGNIAGLWLPWCFCTLLQEAEL
jgi:hypothetical protein